MLPLSLSNNPPAPPNQINETSHCQVPYSRTGQTKRPVVRRPNSRTRQTKRPTVMPLSCAVPLSCSHCHCRIIPPPRRIRQTKRPTVRRPQCHALPTVRRPYSRTRQTKRPAVRPPTVRCPTAEPDKQNVPLSGAAQAALSCPSRCQVPPFGN